MCLEMSAIIFELLIFVVIAVSLLIFSFLLFISDEMDHLLGEFSPCNKEIPQSVENYTRKFQSTLAYTHISLTDAKQSDNKAYLELIKSTQNTTKLNTETKIVEMNNIKNHDANDSIDCS